MSIHVALHHLTHYRYDRPITIGPQTIRLRPCPHTRTRILSYSLRILPQTHFINWQQDPQSNYLARLVFPEKATEFCVEVDLVAEMAVINPFDFFLEPEATETPFSYAEGEPAFPVRYPSHLASELAPFLQKSDWGLLFEAWVAHVPRQRIRTVDFLVAINTLVHKAVRYLIRLEPGVQTPEETLEKASGSCRDSAWLLVQVLRHLGLAARFVSGYLIQLKADVAALDGPSGPAQDFTDLHAWCEVYLPGAGWVGLDPTSGLLAGEGHIPLSCAPEPASAAPVSGLLDECEAVLQHEMTVSRIWEAPRVTLPYSEDAWQAIEALGHRVDERLQAHGLTLTQGGEPTFVSPSNPDDPQWNTTAMGDEKREKSQALYHRLRRHYAPYGLLHFGQGKWYPGEPLPRWSFAAFWRKDGHPIWHDERLWANETAPTHPSLRQVERFAQALACTLGVSGSALFPAYEDVFYALWRERRLPSNVDPFDARLEDPLERERLARLFERGLDTPAGYVLPLGKLEGKNHWQTGRWFLRAERCYLLPGDSPMGFRLPLDSLPWVAPEDYPYLHQPDPFGGSSPLPTPLIRTQDIYVTPMRYGEISDEKDKVIVSAWADSPLSGGSQEDRPSSFDGSAGHGLNEGKGLSPLSVTPPRLGESAKDVVRTAICFEVRRGMLHVFMPPVECLEDYLELVQAIETTAKTMDQPLIIEGYEPPRDARLQHFRITPDPGVIEVNVHPVQSWDALVEQTTFLYEAAFQTGLGTEKFMIDGRHTGTGGGNHFVLGGPEPERSPFFQRPDILGSLLAWWQNHPSLSYLFSGLFIGPTSQAPRVDEGRNESLYELEIALGLLAQRADEGFQNTPPWFIDRLLRHLLTDVTGNTHRAEFCIDKLYSPDGPTGRLGLLELRAFEMPPHARMSLAQQLLLRALLARFADEPYLPKSLVRWGTGLHDRFMLPHFVWDDFKDVLADLKAHGYALEPEWFAPHFEFRFPKYGDLALLGMKLELRAALEPWHVLGEQGAAGGTVRYVDASVERVQVKVWGMPPQRYVLACNGYRVPLQPTGREGEYVAGIRYRAWQPSEALHPTLTVDAPLVFDIIDTWNRKSVGGVQYHVAHPGGRSFDTRPINAFEAESRRLSRYFRFGHTPGPITAQPVESAPEWAFTLDLRHAKTRID
jgi:uncharacterized protein (DUF2126 family)